jgi:hypothetical protein
VQRTSLSRAAAPLKCRLQQHPRVRPRDPLPPSKSKLLVDVRQRRDPPPRPRVGPLPPPNGSTGPVLSAPENRLAPSPLSDRLLYPSSPCKIPMVTSSQSAYANRCTRFARDSRLWCTNGAHPPAPLVAAPSNSSVALCLRDEHISLRTKPSPPPKYMHKSRQIKWQINWILNMASKFYFFLSLGANAFLSLYSHNYRSARRCRG